MGPKPGSKKWIEQKSKKETVLPTAYLENGILILLFSDPPTMRLYLQRAQSYYEKKELRNLRGVNMPYETWKMWRAETDLTPEELQLDQLLQRLDVFYLAGCLAKDRSSLLHEMAHAHYYQTPAYQAQVSRIWQDLEKPVRSHIEQELKMRNYHPDVFEDEFQAFVAESASDFGQKFASVLYPLHKVLRPQIRPAVLDPQSKINFIDQPVETMTTLGTNVDV
ncbi:hypothetical protein EDD86DRAFT_204293 [Gorgonomyces haynaldii]|nr:hypothetical protein EDD86DRAFT_204293 [Gorgonomyces haynaldii]